MLVPMHGAVAACRCSVLPEGVCALEWEWCALELACWPLQGAAAGWLQGGFRVLLLAGIVVPLQGCQSAVCALGLACWSLAGCRCKGLSASWECYYRVLPCGRWALMEITFMPRAFGCHQ